MFKCLSTKGIAISKNLTYYMKETKKMSRIVAFGNPLLDTTVHVNDSSVLRKHNLNEGLAMEISAEDMRKLLNDISECVQFKSPGGCSQNTLRVLQWISRKAHEAIIFGSVGNDSEAEELKAMMNKDGVQTRYVLQNLPTGRTTVLVKDKVNTLVACLGAAECLHLNDLISLQDFSSMIFKANYIYFEGYFLTKRIEAATYILNICKKHKKTVLFNISGKYLLDIIPNDVQFFAENCQYLFGTVDEYEALTKRMGLGSLQEFVDYMLKNNTDKCMVMTNGGNPGYFVCGSNEIKSFDVLKVNNEEVKDPTGAGDSFVGGFIAALCKDKSIEECIKIGNYAAYQIIQQTGCTLPTFEPEIFL